MAFAGAGCGGDDEERTFACDRGFRAEDWRAERLKTAQSAEKCGWLRGWRRRQLVEVLGQPATRSARHLTWEVGSSDRGIGPSAWSLSAGLSAAGRVERASTELRGV